MSLILPIAQQIETLQQLIPQLRRAPDPDSLVSSLPPGADGVYAFPRWQSLGDTYQDACITISRVLEQSRNIAIAPKSDSPQFEYAFPYFGEFLYPRDDYWQQKFDSELRDQKNCDIFVFPAAIFTPRTSDLALVLDSFHFGDVAGLGYFHVLSVLLTHAALLCDKDEPPIYCMREIYKNRRNDHGSTGFPVLSATAEGIEVAVETWPRNTFAYRPAIWFTRHP